MTDPETVPLPPEAQIQAARKTFEAGWARLTAVANEIIIDWTAGPIPLGSVHLTFRKSRGQRVLIVDNLLVDAIWKAIDIIEAK